MANERVPLRIPKSRPRLAHYHNGDTDLLATTASETFEEEKLALTIAITQNAEVDPSFSIKNLLKKYYKQSNQASI